MRFHRSGKRTTEMPWKCHRNATQGWQGICLLPAASGAINVCTLLQVVQVLASAAGVGVGTGKICGKCGKGARNET